MSRPPTNAEKAAVQTLFNNLALEARNKEAARQQLLKIQLLLARRVAK
jgi:hypothetical protein